MYDIFQFKDSKLQLSIINRRIGIVFLLIALMTTLIIVRVFYLTVVDYSYYQTLSTSNNIKLRSTEAIRGLIYSQDGILLAENKLSYSLEIIPEKIEDIDSLITELSKIIKITKKDIALYKQQLKKQKRYNSIPLRLYLNEKEVATFSVNKYYFPNVSIIPHVYRHYPLGSSMAHVLGYMGMIDEKDLQQVKDDKGRKHIGKAGIEKIYDAILYGQSGYETIEVNARGQVIRILDSKSSIRGDNIQLGIHAGIQQVAIEAMQDRIGAVVAMDPNNGNILAMVSTPSYDPNMFVHGIDHDSYSRLINDKKRPLFNRVIQGQYAPGSTIKPFLGIIALRHQVDQIINEIWCPGWYSLKGSSHRFRDWKKGGHGKISFNHAIIQSCDVYFYKLAHLLGIKKIYEGLSSFGFGQLTGIDIEGEKAGLLVSNKKKRYQGWFLGETIIMGIGQGKITATPLQLAYATSAIANLGKFVSPKLKINSNQKSPAHKLSDINYEQWQQVIQSMRDVVHSQTGTARRIGLNTSYKIAGKTGTSQVKSIKQGEEYKEEEVLLEHRDHSLFIAYAPVDDPKLAIAVVVENGGSGSRTAAPIAKKIIDYYLNNR